MLANESGICVQRMRTTGARPSSFNIVNKFVIGQIKQQKKDNDRNEVNYDYDDSDRTRQWNTQIMIQSASQCRRWQAEPAGIARVCFVMLL